MGDLAYRHTVLSRMKERYGIDLETQTPQVPYRETIANGRGKHKKQSGGPHTSRLRPLQSAGGGAGFEFVDSVVGGAVPRTIPAVEQSLAALRPAGGLPRSLCRAPTTAPITTWTPEMSLMAIMPVVPQGHYGRASPVLLEPIMNVEVTTGASPRRRVMAINSFAKCTAGTEGHGKLWSSRRRPPWRRCSVTRSSSAPHVASAASSCKNTSLRGGPRRHRQEGHRRPQEGKTREN